MTWPKLLKLDWEADSSIVLIKVCLQISFFFFLYKIILMEKKFNSLEDCKSHLEKFFAQKDNNLGEGGISKLPEKYQEIVKQNSEDIFFQ